MKIGTKSLLFGVHQFALHPLIIAAAWRRRYGFPWDPRLWLCFLAHDWGYWGKADMNGPEGETHVELGAKIAHWLLDSWQGYQFFGLRVDRSQKTWHDFCLFHSRHYAKRRGETPSRLCVADKLAITVGPGWLYLLLANLSGEIHEYMTQTRGNSDELTLAACQSQRTWLVELRAWARQWVANNS